MKRLYKSRTDKVISGVCGGIAKYFRIDATLIRVAWVVAILIGGIGFFGYIIAMIIVPSEPTEFKTEGDSDVFESDSDSFTKRFDSAPLNIDEKKLKSNLPVILGAVLIGIGILILVSSLGLFDFRILGRFVIPAIVIGLGLYFVLNSKK